MGTVRLALQFMFSTLYFVHYDRHWLLILLFMKGEEENRFWLLSATFFSPYLSRPLFPLYHRSLLFFFPPSSSLVCFAICFALLYSFIEYFSRGGSWQIRFISLFSFTNQLRIFSGLGLLSVSVSGCDLNFFSFFFVVVVFFFFILHHFVRLHFTCSITVMP